MKKLLLISILFVSAIALKAQPYGNEWIDYTQVHYKIKVPTDGIYRISYSTLLGANPNIGNVQVKDLALYHNGAEVPMFNSATGSYMTSSDYIFFYGKKNVGDVDAPLYKNPAYQPHQYYSLFNDTSTYYLTVRSTLSNPVFTTVQNNLNNTPPAEAYFMYQSRQLYTGQNIQGAYQFVDNDEVFSPVFDNGEGYCDINYFGDFPVASTHQYAPLSYTVPTPALYSAGPAPTFISVYANVSPDVHSVYVQLNGNFVVQGQNATGFALNKLNIPFSNSQITGNSTSVTYSAVDAATSYTENVVYMNEIDYARQYDFGGQNAFYFQMAGDPVNKKYIIINNYNDNGLHPILFDLTNHLVINSTVTPGTPPKFVLPVSASMREMFIISGDPSSYTAVTQLIPTVFTNYTKSNISCQGDYIIIADTSAADAGLTQDIDGDGYNEVEDYRRYRDVNANPNVGRYHARIMDINQLYDQFAYGVRKSPLAIRNFIHFAVDSWNTYKPQHVFIIGKGREYPDTRSNPGANAQCLVPTFGQPASDNLLAGSTNSDVPVVAIGRIAADSAYKVNLYLNKMKAYELAQTSTSVNPYPNNEDIPPKIWQKQIVHFSGGTDFFEQSTFQGYLGAFAQTAKDTFWGANVTTYTKTSSNPISQAEAQVIMNQIDSGVALLTFFGHSATGAFDFSIDEPENYTNYGKYPVILSNGCFSGLIFAATPGYSERFVLEPNHGSIAFIAASDLTIASGLYSYSSLLYDTFCVSRYDNTIGNCIKQDITTIYTNPSYNSTQGTFNIISAYEMTLHGDPALYLDQYPKPDYALAQNYSSVYFTPAIVTPNVDSFQVNVICTNLGKAINKTIAISVVRTVSDSVSGTQSFTYKKFIAAPYYIDTVSFTIPTRISNLGYGLNTFVITLDADDVVNEMAKGNNCYGCSTYPGNLGAISINIQSDDISPIYPYEYAIDSDKVVTVKASTTNPFAAYRKYDFQMDTSQLYNSPMLQTYSLSQVGGVLHWTPNITYKDSQVYYWRCKIDTSSNWHYTSFMHLHGQYGWNQSHFFQYLDDSYVNLSLDSSTRFGDSTQREFRFPPTTSNVTVLTGFANAEGGNLDFETMGWNYNNSNMYRFRMGGCGFNAGITFAVIDPVTGPWQSVNVLPAYSIDNWGDTYGNYHCASQPVNQYGFDFFTNGVHPTGSGTWSGVGWSTLISNFINSIPANDYVLIYSDDIVQYNLWDTILQNALGSLGFPAHQFVTGTYTGPFAYFMQKGTGFSPKFAYTQSFYTPVSLSVNFTSAWFQGQVTSTLIGPAVKWGSMEWSKHSIRTPVDQDTVDIIGVTYAGVQRVLLSTTHYSNVIQNINAQQYPYLQLRLRTNNSTTMLPAQLDYWRVIYQKPAEVAVNPAAYYLLQDSNMSLGSSLKLGLAIENVTKIKMDSVLVKYTLRDNANNSYVYNRRYARMPGIDTLILRDTFPISQSTFQGSDYLNVEVNPGSDHLEQFHFNNYGLINFRTTGDITNPLLDVTFDGRHIFDGDIVSARPDILIMLKDESKVLALNDTGAVIVYIIPPGSSTPLRINYDGTVLRFYPADSTALAHGNKAQSEYKPDYTVDGTYTLLVKDMDRSGNHSSNQSRYIDNVFYDYKITFQVINKAMITNVLNYPNPFTTQTRFVFTLTGSEVPDYMKIQIMTIRGIVVKEITKDELGPIHIGTNITEYAWDGRDQYGSNLANGVYFYRVVTRLDNKNMDKLGESYDQYFKKGIGKMVLVR